MGCLKEFCRRGGRSEVRCSIDRGRKQTNKKMTKKKPPLKKQNKTKQKTQTNKKQNFLTTTSKMNT